MADVASILNRVRHHGARLLLDGDNLRVINGNRLPVEVGHVIRQHRSELIAMLKDKRDDIEERAAIIEFDGAAPREIAVRFAEVIATARDGGVPREALPQFLNACGRIIDEELGGAA